MTQLALDLSIVIPGLRFGITFRRKQPASCEITSYYLDTDHDDDYAGHICRYPDGSVLVIVSHGCKITGPNCGGSNSLRIPLGKVDYATAERRLLDEAIVARSNPALLWSHVVTPAAKRIAMANGWWKQEGEAA